MPSPRPTEPVSIFQRLASSSSQGTSPELPKSWRPLLLSPRPDPNESRRYRLPDLPSDPSKINSPAFVDAIQKAEKGKLKWPLYVTGTVGTGKTCACLSVVERAYGAEFFRLRELMTEFRRVVCGELIWQTAPGYSVKVDEAVWWKWISGLSLVVLDDFGAKEKVSANDHDAVFMLLEKRAMKPLIITSNLSVTDACTNFGERIFDRIDCGTLVKFQGESRR